MTPAEMESNEHEAIRSRLTAIETKLDIVLTQHTASIAKLEAAQGKQYLISSTMSALGIALVLLAKYLFKVKA